ncbi:hypothetical protein J4434_00975 [Candidatus Woesearchaeota archaeon]|nr:hypothetical protein [Candidatus Woesearchaeota archaeon]
MLKRGVFKDKRGISIDKLFLAEAILIAIVAIGIFAYINNLSENTLFEKKVIIRDLSLLANTIQSVPGNVYYEYIPSKKTKSKDYIYSFSDNMVTISENAYKISYPLFYNTFLLFQVYPITQVEKFTISNFNNVFVIAPEKVIGIKYEKGKSVEAIEETKANATTKSTEKENLK